MAKLTQQEVYNAMGDWPRIMTIEVKALKEQNNILLGDVQRLDLMCESLLNRIKKIEAQGEGKS